MKSLRRFSRWHLPLSFALPAAVVLGSSPVKAQDAGDPSAPVAVEGATNLRSTQTQIQAALVEARAELAVLRERYQDGHPTVRQQLVKIAALEKQVAAGGGGGATTLTSTVSVTPPRFVTLDFPGGSLQQLLEVVGKADASSFNLIVDDRTVHAKEVQVRAFSLRNAPPAAVAATLSFFLADQKLAVEKLISDQFQGGQLQVGPDVYVVRPPQSGGNSTRFESFQLDSYLGAQSIDDIVGAIRAAWELDPAHRPDRLQLKFHPGTSLLLVSGSQDAVGVAMQVITHLRRDRTPPAPRSAPAPTPPPTK